MPQQPLATDPNTFLHVPNNASERSGPASLRPTSAVFAATHVVYSDPDFATPPPLNYTLRTRIKWIIIFWSLVILDCVCMPIALYFGLWYGTHLTHNAGRTIS